MRRAAVCLGACLALAAAGCANAPPVPLDRFYRLPEPQGTGAARPARGWGDMVLVEPFRADGLHTERALLLSEDAQAVTLVRYHYHHWVDGPPRLVQEYVATRIRAAAPSAIVLTEPEGAPASVVAGKVKRFEHHVHGDPAGRVLVTLELRLSRAGHARPLLARDYSSEVPVSGEGMTAAVEAFGRAMEHVTDAFLREAQALPPAR